MQPITIRYSRRLGSVTLAATSEMRDAGGAVLDHI
jgi:hypothetical protein